MNNGTEVRAKPLQQSTAIRIALAISMVIFAFFGACALVLLAVMPFIR